MRRAARNVDHRGGDAPHLQKLAYAHRLRLLPARRWNAAIGRTCPGGNDGRRAPGQNVRGFSHGVLMMIHFPHDAVFPVRLQGDGAFDDKHVLAVKLFGFVQHTLEGELPFGGHDCGMEMHRNDFQQHFGDAGVGVVEQGHGAARTPLPFDPEHRRALPGQRFRKHIPHERVKHAGNPDSRHRPGANTHEVSSGKFHRKPLVSVTDVLGGGALP